MGLINLRLSLKYPYECNDQSVWDSGYLLHPSLSHSHTSPVNMATSTLVSGTDH
jgi:hypothetical protein